jgi:hypothetical protein
MSGNPDTMNVGKEREEMPACLDVLLVPAQLRNLFAPCRILDADNGPKLQIATRRRALGRRNQSSYD